MLIISLDTNKILKVNNEDYEIGYFCISEKRMEIACKSNDILIYDTSGNIRDIIKYDYPVETISYDNSEKYLVILYKNLTLKTYDLEERKFANSINLDFIEYDKYDNYFLRIDENNNVTTDNCQWMTTMFIL